MTNSTLKATLVATTVALSLLAPAAQSQAAKPTSIPATVGQVIAAQGNAALRVIRAEMAAAVKAAKPELPARAKVKKVSAPAMAPASGSGSIPATAARAE
ncbi:MAG: hypothetical protein ACREE7_18200 [Dongiaceae bacterium]